MKIGEFSDSFLPVVDGVGRVVYSYCDRIARRNEECTAIVPLTKMGYRGGFPFEIIDYFSKPLPGMKQYQVGAPFADEHYHNRIEMTDFEIAHIHTPFIAGREGIRYAKKHGIPLVGTFHSKYYDDFKQITGSKVIAGISIDVMVREFFNKCDEVWAPTASSAHTLGLYGYQGNVIVMPNGIELRVIDPSQKDMAVRKFGIRTDVPVFLYVGQINWKKNLETILKACAGLDQEYQLVFAGQGPHEAEIRKMSVKLGIGDRLVMTGHIKDTALLDGIYSAADLFLFPSLYDTAGLVVSEAANAGVPAVCVEGSSASEVIRNGENGFLCRNNADSLRETVKHVIAEPERLKQIGEAAKTTIPVSWDTVTDLVLGRYRNLIEENQKAN